jgi:hypothetical protein
VKMTKQALYIFRNIEVRPYKHYCSGKAMSFSQPVCVCVCVFVALVIQHAMRMRRMSSVAVAWHAVHYFSTFSHKQRGFRKKVTAHKMCVLIFCTTFV